jgi:hypothetical protein
MAHVMAVVVLPVAVSSLVGAHPQRAVEVPGESLDGPRIRE